MATQADALVDLAVAAITASAATIPGTTISVTPDDFPDVDPDTGDLKLSPGEMRVFVGWASYADAGWATRGDPATETTLVVLAVERYGEPGRVTNDWRRARSEWVDEAVVNPLGSEPGKLGTAWAERVDEVIFDRESLAAHKLFWCQVTITYRDEG